MIRYDLKCSQGHEFDSWFGSSADFDKLTNLGMISCVTCGSADVQKAIMAPRVTKAISNPISSPILTAAQIVQQLRTKVEASAENVGTEFANEARRIHQGDAPARPIIGEAKVEDAKALIDEGVEITPLPWGKRKVN